MPFTLLKGTFEPSLGRPDGGSLRFVADNPDPIFRLKRRGWGPEINESNGSIQLRYEGIDTMERRALEPYPARATEANLDLAGTNGGQHSARGHIYSNQLGPRGRPIAFVFAGTTVLEDGCSVHLSPNDIETSVNFQLLEQGHAYPLFYDTLFDDLREHLTMASERARASKSNIWSADGSNSGVRWTGSVENLPPVIPKLWRRIDSYSSDEEYFDANRPFANFLPWLRRQPEERVIVLGRDRITGFDNLIATTNDTIRLIVEPRNMVIISA